jgi:Domain of unknown function (DUF6946)
LRCASLSVRSNGAKKILCTDVRDCLPDDRKYHYQDGFSMAEAAKCWVAAGEHLPRSIADVVGSGELIAAHFEYPTKVCGGGLAMTDVMAFVPNGVIAVEAKVNERFDDLVSAWIFKEEKKNAESPPHRTRVIQHYAEAFRVSSEQLLDIRYQLLQRTLCAALTAQVQDASQAWMVVQAFASPTKGAPGHETTVHYAGAFVHDRQDVLALADHLELQGTNRVMRNQESLEHHLRLAAKAIRALLRDRAPGDQIICDER